MKQQTAVEWLEEKLNIWQTISDEDTNSTLNTVRKLLEQAKQMEKREKRSDIVSAFESGKLMGKDGSNKTGDEYYFCNYIDNE